ncbi:hypothetical protein TWF696_001542 [Orbilia brochopaga]|uniref:Uncharacterized protein n=1 Tax=Orbilia brochopaga TaxID=3140254 RepID=A0AAV9U9Q9_9PEZI
MVERQASASSSLFLLDDDEVKRAQRREKFKFHDEAALSTEQQLVVQKARTPQGHAQDWAAFELADGTKLGHARLHWRTKYVSVAPSPQSPGNQLQSKTPTSVPHFFLDLFYYSKDIKYRFAVRVHRAEISSVSSNADQYILLNLTNATEWDPPKGCNYEGQPEKPARWLTLPVTLKLRAKTQDSFSQLAAEMEVLCRSQNHITWNTTLNQKHTQEKVEAAAVPRRRSEGLNRLTARLRGQSPPQQDSRRPFLFDIPQPSAVASSSSTPTSSTYSSADGSLDGRVMTDGWYEPRFVRRDSTPSVCDDGNAFGMGPFTPQWDRYSIHRAPTGWADVSNTVTVQSPPLVTPPKTPTFNPKTPTFDPKTPILNQKRSAPSPSLSPRSSRVLKKSRGDEMPAATDSQTSLEDGEIRETDTTIENQDVTLLQAKLRTQEMAQALEDKDADGPPPTISDGETATTAPPETAPDNATPDPTYRFIGTGRNLDEEFGRKLTFEESVLAQWIEESDKRLGRIGSRNLDRVAAADDKDHIEEDDDGDVSMEISPQTQSPA